MKGVLVAGPASGVGKTTITLAIAAALRARGLQVQAFKCGPDFLDTGHLTSVTGRPARNLDGWMMDRAQIVEAFNEASTDADFAIVEGMMGLFDGISGGGEEGSSAEIAKVLSLPVVLVGDASKSARSLAAVIRGFEVFDPQLRFAGVVLNGVGCASHYRLLADAILPSCNMPILGWIPREPAAEIPERHLGLHTAAEIDWKAKHCVFEALGQDRLNLDLLLGCELPKRPSAHAVHSPATLRRATIGIARDEAFCFYYQDNLDLLERAGATLVAFSPLHDSTLPPGLDGLYLGGGYPELHAAQLSGNKEMLRQIRAFAHSGRPLYAECGGMMYLGERVRTRDGSQHPMVGALPLDTGLTEHLVRFGYTEVELLTDSLLGPRGTVLRGHSFHHSWQTNTRDVPPAFRARYTLSGATEEEGYASGNVFASYIHLHFRGSPAVAERFVALAQQHALGKAEAL